jgi:hypothetical protein
MQVSGLTILDLVIDAGSATPTARVWRVEPIGDPNKARALRVFLDTTPDDRHAYWDVCEGRVYVAKNEDYREPWVGSTALVPYVVGNRSGYEWEDYSEALIVILQPRAGVLPTQPPASARVKDDRLVLWIRRPSGSSNWTARWQTYPLKDGQTLRHVAAEFNRSYVIDRGAPGPNGHPRVLADVETQRSLLDSRRYWFLALPSGVGLIIAADVAAHGAIQVLGIAVGSVVGLVSIAGLLGSLRRPLRKVIRHWRRLPPRLS